MKLLLIIFIIIILNFISKINCGVTQSNDQILITGSWNNPIDSYFIKLGTIDIKSTCSINSDNNLMTCTLKSDSKSGKLVISDNNGVITNVNLLLTPYIKSITPKVLPTQATKVTINGMFFNSNSTIGSTETNVMVAIGYSNIDIKSTSDSSIEFYSPNSFQNPTTIYISIANKKSNSIKFNYEKPILNSIEFKPSKNGVSMDELIIIGSNFGSSQSKDLVKVEIIDSITNVTISTLGPILNINDTFIQVSIPIDSSSGKIRVNCNGGLSNLLDLLLIPSISDVSKPNFENGEINIYGHYLDSIYLLNFKNETIKLNQCTLNTITDNNSPSTSFSKTCKFPNRLSNDSIEFSIFSRSTVNNKDYDSNLFNSNYEKPIIKSIDPNGFYIGQKLNFTFSGLNFANNNQTFIKIQKRDCLILNINSDTIVCYFDSGSSSDGTSSSMKNPILYTVSVDGQLNDPNLELDELNSISIYSLCPGQQFNNTFTPQSEGCSGNGNCNKILGECTCKPTFQSFDCSVQKYPNSSIILTFSSFFILSLSLLLLILF